MREYAEKPVRVEVQRTTQIVDEITAGDPLSQICILEYRRDGVKRLAQPCIRDCLLDGHRNVSRVAEAIEGNENARLDKTVE